MTVTPLQPTVVGAWDTRLGAVGAQLARIDRRHADAVNDIRSRMAALASIHDLTVRVETAEPLLWLVTLQAVAHRIGTHDVTGVIGSVCADIAKAVQP